jgi:hypothetical protein
MHDRVLYRLTRLALVLPPGHHLVLCCSGSGDA